MSLSQAPARPVSAFIDPEGRDNGGRIVVLQVVDGNRNRELVLTPREARALRAQLNDLLTYPESGR